MNILHEIFPSINPSKSNIKRRGNPFVIRNGLSNIAINQPVKKNDRSVTTLGLHEIMLWLQDRQNILQQGHGKRKKKTEFFESDFKRPNRAPLYSIYYVGLQLEGETS